MKNRSTQVLTVLLVIAVSVIIYQNYQVPSSVQHDHDSETSQLYTCGMHPDILSEEPGNCPICEMKLTPVKQEKNSGQRQIAYWVAPMDPNEIYDSPGKSKMRMDLVPVYEDEITGGALVKIDPVVQQNMNIKTVIIERADLSNSLITNGIVAVDERNEHVVSSKYGGWIEKLYVNFTGQEIRKDDKIFEIYSPDLFAAQQEYISALDYYSSLKNTENVNLLASAKDLVNNAEQKLLLLDISDKEVNRLRTEKKVNRTVPVYSPVNGIVTRISINEGSKINKGGMILHITDFSNLWILADVYEHELHKIRVGAEAVVKFNAFPQKVIRGKVSFIYPTLEKTTRTIKVRIDIANENGMLKPDMLASVEFSSSTNQNSPVIPEEAVIRSGSKDIAVVALDEGKFKPVELELGIYSDGNYQLLSGLSEGSRVVTSAQFLIDSESNLKSAISKFIGSPDSTQNMEKKSLNDGHDHMDDSPLVRKGIIDLNAIDANNDGKLFECPMDWNVLSDHEGRCPLCEMYLKEYTIEDVKVNLTKHGYEYKK